MKEKTVFLNGGEEFITDDNSTVITVDSGTALVFIVPAESERRGRKLLLAEVPEGGRIPSLSYRDDEDINYSFGIMALDRMTGLSFETSDDRADVIREFTELHSIGNVDRLGYEEAVAEVYRMYQVKDDAFIYQAEKDSRYYYTQTLREIYKSFEKDNKTDDRSEQNEASGRDYRSLPERKITVHDIALFMIKEISAAELAKYLIMSLLGLSAGILLTWLNKLVFDEFIPKNDLHELIFIGGVILAFSAGSIIFGIARNIASLKINTSVKYKLQSAIIQRLLNLPVELLETVDSADLAGRVAGLGSLFAGLIPVISGGLISLIYAAISAGLMIGYSKVLTAAGLIILFIRFVIFWLITVIRVRIEKEKLETEGRLDSRLYQALNGIEKIRLSGSENNILYRYILHFLKLKRIGQKSSGLEMVSEASETLFGQMLTAAAVIVVALNLTSLSVGEYMAFATAYGIFSGAVTGLLSIYTAIRSVTPEWERARFIFDNAPENADGTALTKDFTGRIDIDNVVFGYEKDQKVIDGLSLHIEPGEYVGIVGASGSGKSTLLRLLLGFSSPDRGKIYYDNMDLATLDKKALRKKMGVVLQDDNLISGSIAENLSIMNPGLTTDRMMELMEAVGMREDILKMPMGLYTVLDSENPVISGGQKQRLMIARALASDPGIILFDEATSALDNITQSMLCNTLQKLDTTRIVIAHRLSTVMNCDRIVVLADGKIAEAGTYEELISQNGIFAAMALRQIA